MARPLSPAAFREMYAQESSDAFLICLTLSHPNWLQPLRVVYNNRPVTRSVYGPVTFGPTDTSGSVGAFFGGSHRKGVNRLVLGQATTFDTLKIYSETAVPGAGVTPLVYADAGGLPGAQLFRAPATVGLFQGWNDLPLYSNLTLQPGTYHVGFATDVTVNTRLSAGQGYYNAVTYLADGPIALDPFGTPTSTPWQGACALAGQSLQSVEFTPAIFDIDLPADEADQIPEIQLSIDNVDRSITDTLRSIQGRVKVNMEVVLGSNPDDVQFGPAEFNLMSMGYNVYTVTGTLSLEDDTLGSVFPASKYTPANSPGIYR